MQSTQLTEPESAFVLDIFTAYRNRRLAAIRKSGKATSAYAMEKQSLAVIVDKLGAIHQQAKNELAEPQGEPFTHHHYQEQIALNEHSEPVMTAVAQLISES